MYLLALSSRPKKKAARGLYLLADHSVVLPPSLTHSLQCLHSNMASTALHCGGDSWELASAASKIHGFNQTNSHAAAAAAAAARLV